MMKLLLMITTSLFLLCTFGESFAKGAFDPSKEAMKLCKKLKVQNCQAYSFGKDYSASYAVVINKKELSSSDASKALDSLKTDYKYAQCFDSVGKESGGNSTLCMISRFKPRMPSTSSKKKKG